MIPNAIDRHVSSGGIKASGTFDISKKDTAHIMGILRDTLYTDRVLAVLREYSSNAWDANREIGRGKTPIRVFIPTAENPTLIIRDNGPGLSDEDIFEIYTQYGASTKRNSNEVVGNLGIGCKSAFAYSDTFTVTSWHKGRKRIYVAVLDNSDLGVMQRLHEEPCPANETGIEIKIAVQQKDIREFHEKARKLFSYFTPRPYINIELEPEEEKVTRLKSGTLYLDRGEWVALMGCVPYRINTKQLQVIDGAAQLLRTLDNLSGTLNFEIGEVEISASREELKYTEKTNMTLLSHFETLIDEYVQYSLKILKDKNINAWTKRLRLHGLKKLGLSIPDDNKDWLADYVILYKEEDKDIKSSFNISHSDKKSVNRIKVDSSTRFVVRDNRLKVKGYHLKYYDYVVNPKPRTSLKVVYKELNKLIEKVSLTGIEVIDISTLSFSDYRAGRQYEPNKKHQISSFKYNGEHSSYNRAKSDSWDIVQHIPSDDDIFVILDRFIPIGIDIYYHYKEDKQLAEALSIEMPDIYGYKTTDKKPIGEEDCKGTPYKKWRKDFFKKAITPYIQECIENIHWKKAIAFSNSFFYHRKGTYQEKIEQMQEWLNKLVGSNHSISKLFAKYVEATNKLLKVDKKLQEALPILIKRLEETTSSKAEIALENIEKQYPLLKRYGSVKNLWNADDYYKKEPTFKIAKEWAAYIKMIDAANHSKKRKGEQEKWRTQVTRSQTLVLASFGKVSPILFNLPAHTIKACGKQSEKKTGIQSQDI